MDTDREQATNERREYDPPQLIVLATVEEATLSGGEVVSDGTLLSNVPQGTF
jgi:hypothetical protein